MDILRSPKNRRFGLVAFACLTSAIQAEVDFVADVVPALTRARCNSGPCHGSPSGKNGFRLSLQGYLPEEDYKTLCRDQFGRRVDRSAPASSLLLLKGLGAVPHEGGKRLAVGDPTQRALIAWIAAGCPTSKSGPRLTTLTVTPNACVVSNDQPIRLTVVASYADGSTRDVTERVYFSSSDDRIARVTTDGEVQFEKPGDAAILCRYRHLIATARMALVKTRPDFQWQARIPWNEVDGWVFGRLRERQILPAAVTDDATFIRRLWLDVSGSLPPVEVTLDFLRDSAPNKRQRAIDNVLECPEYAEFWAMKWADILRSSRKKAGVRGVRLLQTFLTESIQENLPFDKIARRLILAFGDADNVPEANFYRIAGDAQDCGEATAQLWLGIRIQCAKCHNHPFDRWTQDDYFGLAAFFSNVQRKPGRGAGETIFAGNKMALVHPRTGHVAVPCLLGESSTYSAKSPLDENGLRDARERLADWIVDPSSGRFARAVVNRVWFHLLGRGIVDPPDDFRDSNPPSNDELLNGLAANFIKSGHDLKALIRLIVSSQTYQLAAESNSTNIDDNRFFSRAYPRTIAAEVLLDIVGSVAGRPDRFPGLPASTRTVQLPDGDLDHPFLREFGQPTRETTCECGRGSDPTLAQTLSLMNGPTVNDKITASDNRISQMLSAGFQPLEIGEALFLTAYCRWPTTTESGHIRKLLQQSVDKRKALEDVLWSLFNSKEFVLRH